ncbi:MAG: hypothetical protein Q9167_006219 [Letrouitia subvulpina]
MVAHSPNRRNIAVKYIMSASDGFIKQSEILEQRLIECEGVEQVQSFCQPRQHVQSWKSEQVEWGGLNHMLANSVGAILLKNQPSVCSVSALAVLEFELGNRLAMPWISRQPIPNTVVVLVGGRDEYTTQPMLQAAKSLGIELVVMDEPGHWLQSLNHKSRIAKFVPIDMTINDELPMRIIDALGQIEAQIEGLTSNWDGLTLPVAQAAAFLGLPHESLAALEICRDKFKQKMMSGDPVVKLRKGDEPKSVAIDFDYPMVVKPSSGSHSEGVSKVNDGEELAAAVDRVFTSTYNHMGTDLAAVNVEKYCEGPEVDVNVVLLDGKMIFVEIADDFPKDGDKCEGVGSRAFKESAIVYPSALPSSEIEEIKASIHRLLNDIGLRNGIYHVEARVNKSRMQYFDTDGILDLQYKPDSLITEKIDIVLIEVNPRLPGPAIKPAVNATYGINYDALHLLISIGDFHRAKALSEPFLKGPQFWSTVLHIQSDRAGKFMSDDIGEDLKSRYPELAHSVFSSHTYFRRGDMVPAPTPDSQPRIASLLVFSRTSRRDLMEKAKQIRAELKFELL